jgi:hypothetical protein
MSQNKYNIQQFLKSSIQKNNKDLDKTPFTAFITNEIEKIKEAENPELLESLESLFNFLENSNKKTKKEILNGLIDFFELKNYANKKETNELFLSNASIDESLFKNIIGSIFESGLEINNGKISLDGTIAKILFFKSIEDVETKIIESKVLDTQIIETINKKENTIFSKFARSGAIDLFYDEILSESSFLTNEEKIRIKENVKKNLVKSGMTPEELLATKKKIEINDFDKKFGTIYKPDDEAVLRIKKLIRNESVFENKVFKDYCEDQNIVYVSAFEKIQWQSIGKNNDLFKGNMSVPSFVKKDQNGNFEKIILNISPITGSVSFSEQNTFENSLGLACRYFKALEIPEVEIVNNKSFSDNLPEIPTILLTDDLKEVLKSEKPLKFTTKADINLEKINKISQLQKTSKIKIIKS